MGLGIKHRIELRVVQPVGRRSSKAGSCSALEAEQNRVLADVAATGDALAPQSMSMVQVQDLSNATHGDSVGWHGGSPFRSRKEPEYPPSAAPASQIKRNRYPR